MGFPFLLLYNSFHDLWFSQWYFKWFPSNIKLFLKIPDKRDVPITLLPIFPRRNLSGGSPTLVPNMTYRSKALPQSGLTGRKKCQWRCVSSLCALAVWKFTECRVNLIKPTRCLKNHRYNPKTKLLILSSRKPNKRPSILNTSGRDGIPRECICILSERFNNFDSASSWINIRSLKS